MFLKCLLSSTEDLLIDNWKELLFVFMWERKKSDLFLNKMLEELALVSYMCAVKPLKSMK